MENLEKRSVFIQKIFEVFFHSTLILMLFSWACPISVRGRQIPFFEISYILLFLTFLVRLVCDFKFSIPQIFRHYLAIIKSSKPIFWALVLYMAYGAATVLFAKSKMFSLSRYITVIQMLAFCVFLFYYVFPKDKRCDSRQKLRSVFLDLGIASILISITAIIGYLTGIYTVYVRKMSTIIDYNQFAIVILIGFVAFCGVMIRSSQPVVSKYVWIAIVAILDISVILLSGSRRCFIIVLLFVMLLVATAVATEIRDMKKNGWQREDVQKRQISVILAVAVVWCSVGGTVYGFEKLFDRKYERASESGAPTEFVSESFLKGEFLIEKDLSSRMDSIVSGGAMNRRIEIWHIASEEIKSWPVSKLLFGGGASNSWDIYDNTSNPSVQFLLSEYQITEHVDHWMNTHNFLLNDFMEGGLLLFSLQLILLVSMLLYVIKLIKKKSAHGLLMLSLYGIIFISLMLSAPYGMTWNKFFWILLGCQFCENRLWLARDQQ